MWRFFDVDQGVSLCKLSREYFWLWVITVKQTQPGPPDVFLANPRQVQNKRISNSAYSD